MTLTNRSKKYDLLCVKILKCHEENNSKFLAKLHLDYMNTMMSILWQASLPLTKPRHNICYFCNELYSYQFLLVILKDFKF